MPLNKLALALAFTLSALPLSALAQEASTEKAATADAAQTTGAVAPAPPAAAEATPALTWNVALTSDYVFRGVSQTNRKPALQAGLNYAFGDSGFYAGLWASNVDFNDPDGPNIELDSFVGWGKDLSTDWSVDLSVIHYGYFGDSNGYGSIAYNEFIGKATWHKMITGTVAYANDYANLGYTSVYVNLSGSWDVGNGFSVNAGAGHSKFGGGNGSLNDWTVGVGRQFGPMHAALSYFDTNTSGPRLSDALVLTLAFGSGG